jgi:hypothetical protein
MKLTRDIQSLSTFKRDTAKVVRQLKNTGQPVVLTVKDSSRSLSRTVHNQGPQGPRAPR